MGWVIGCNTSFFHKDYCSETTDGEDQNFDQNDFDYTKIYTHTNQFIENNNFYIPL